MKLEYRSHENLNPAGKKLGTVGFRPNASIWFVLVFGIVLMILFRNLIGIITGIIVAGLAVFYLAMVKDHPVIDVYEKELVIYDMDHPDKAALVPCSMITEYYVPRENSGDVSLRFADGDVLVLKSMQKSRAYTLLGKVLPKRSSDDINLKNSRHFFTKEASHHSS